MTSRRQGSIPNRAIRIPDDEWQAAQEMARANGETVSEVVRRALRRYVARRRKDLTTPA